MHILLIDENENYNYLLYNFIQTVLANFLLTLLRRLEYSCCGVDGFEVEAILLGGGAAAYVLDEHSKPSISKPSIVHRHHQHRHLHNDDINNIDNNNNNNHDDNISNGGNDNEESKNDHHDDNKTKSFIGKYPPLHYNDVDLMLEIKIEEWHNLIAKWTKLQQDSHFNENDNKLINDEEIGNDDKDKNEEAIPNGKNDCIIPKDTFELKLPFRNAEEHHVAVYAAIRTAFLECLRDFAPKDMQNVDVEDICAAYIDTQKRVCFCFISLNEATFNIETTQIYTVFM